MLFRIHRLNQDWIEFSTSVCKNKSHVRSPFGIGVPLFHDFVPLSGAGEDEDGPVVESGEGGVEPDSYWKKKEAFLRGSNVSLGEKFSSGTFKDLPDLWYFSTEKLASHQPV